jgi:hypothetical protein
MGKSHVEDAAFNGEHFAAWRVPFGAYQWSNPIVVR